MSPDSIAVSLLAGLLVAMVLVRRDLGRVTRGALLTIAGFAMLLVIEHGFGWWW